MMFHFYHCHRAVVHWPISFLLFRYIDSIFSCFISATFCRQHKNKHSKRVSQCLMLSSRWHTGRQRCVVRAHCITLRFGSVFFTVLLVLDCFLNGTTSVCIRFVGRKYWHRKWYTFVELLHSRRLGHRRLIRNSPLIASQLHLSALKGERTFVRLSCSGARVEERQYNRDNDIRVQLRIFGSTQMISIGFEPVKMTIKYVEASCMEMARIVVSALPKIVSSNALIRFYGHKFSFRLRAATTKCIPTFSCPNAKFVVRNDSNAHISTNAQLPHYYLPRVTQMVRGKRRKTAAGHAVSTQLNELSWEMMFMLFDVAMIHKWMISYRRKGGSAPPNVRCYHKQTSSTHSKPQ